MFNNNNYKYYWALVPRTMMTSNSIISFTTDCCVTFSKWSKPLLELGLEFSFVSHYIAALVWCRLWLACFTPIDVLGFIWLMWLAKQWLYCLTRPYGFLKAMDLVKGIEKNHSLIKGYWDAEYLHWKTNHRMFSLYRPKWNGKHPLFCWLQDLITPLQK